MKNFKAMERDSKRAAIKACAENQQIIIDCRKATDAPDKTVWAIVDRLGYGRAVEAVAELVNTVSDWDERVSNINRAWAVSIDTAATRDELRSVCIFSPSEIHPAHIDQIADYMRRYEPQQEAEENTQAAEMARKEEKEMECKIVDNSQYGSKEIYFEGKPAEEIREALKSLHFRWNGKKSCWYGFADSEKINAALSGCKAEEAAEESKGAEKKTGRKSAQIPPLWERCRLDSLPGYATDNEMKKTAREAARVNSSSYDKEAAKIIRSHLKARFPEVKFSVTSGGAGWLNNVDIVIKSAPWSYDLVKGDINAIYDCDRWDHNEASPELEAVLNYCNKLYDSFDADDGDIYADYGAHHDLYGNVRISYDYTQTKATPEQLSDAAAFRAAKAEHEAEEEARQRAEIEKAIEERKAAAEAAQIVEETNRKIVSDIESAVKVEDVPESEQFIISGLVGGHGKEITLEEVKRSIARDEEDGTQETKKAVISRKVYFQDEKSFCYFCNLFIYDYSFLACKGGVGTFDSRVNDENFMKLNKEQRASVDWLMMDCVAVYVGDELRLVIDPEGYGYARYVYILLGTCEDVETVAECKKRAETETGGKGFYFPAPLAEQAQNIANDDNITILSIDPWTVQIMTERGKVERVEPCQYAQYIDALRLTYRKEGKRISTEKYIYGNNETVIYKGLLPELPQEMLYTSTSSDLIKRVNYAGSGVHDFIIECIEYYKSLEFEPILDNIQR